MKRDPSQLAMAIEQQSDPEPFSGVVAVTEGDETRFAHAHGLAVRSESIPHRIDTRLAIASGCKAFTAVAILQLVERGALSLDTRLSECTDVAFPHYAPDITIGHLLTHRAGITSYFEEDVDPDYEAIWRDVPMYRIRRVRDLLPLFKDKPMKFPPGERFEYNDGGYVLLGLVIEAAVGTDFAEYVRAHVFEPAGMTDAGYFAADQLPERTALAYLRNEDGSWRTNTFAVPAVGGPDGGAFVTADDMTRFWSALTQHRLLGREATARMLDPAIATGLKSPYEHYGHGVWIDAPDGAVRKIFVEGLDPGVAMRSAIYPATGVGLTVIGNTDGATWPLYRRIESLLGL